ncbi:hypothetical protein DFH09DRAFT_1306021 [Mycena vulgaris]|nr:hypothetical protein DFH09DRAFT_1306021 [Mycena vulgaris]
MIGFLFSLSAIPLSAPSYYPLARSQYSTSSYYPPSSTSSSNVNALSYIQLLVFVAANAHSSLVHPVPASGHPPRTSPARSVASSNATQSETETETEPEPETEHITRYSVETPLLSVSSELYYRLLCRRDASCLAADMFIGQIKALKKILTVDAEIEGGRLSESWFESMLDRSIDPKDDSFWIDVMSPSEGALTKLREALLVGSIQGGEMFSYKDGELEWMGTETDNGCLEPAYPGVFGEIH